MGIRHTRTRLTWASAFLVGLLMLGCTPEEPPAPAVTSHLSGRITVSAAVDSTDDYSGFRVMVAQVQGRTVDTLAHAVTERDGTYETPVTATERGIYPLIIWGREGRQRLFVTEYVVADGDSATLSMEVPQSRRNVQVRSPENAALIAYRNTMALHRQRLVQQIQQTSLASQTVAQSVRQTSSLLWSLRTTYPDTYATHLAEVQSLALLEGWNDSLVVARAKEVVSDNPRYVEAARIARRAESRQRGLASAVTLIQDFQAKAANDAQRAGLQAALVRTYADSLRTEDALAAARTLLERYPDSEWAEWANRASYEIETLMPGMPAPDFSLTTLDGETVALDSLRGRPILLEFYRPGNQLFVQQIPTRNALYEATRTDSVAFVTVSVESDSVLTQAFFDGRSLPGLHTIAPGGSDDALVERYNIGSVPTRYLIAPDGTIVEKYVGSAFVALQDELLTMVGLTRQDAGLVPAQ